MSETSSTAPAASASFWRALGPGLLFAGAAVGVSHLVQSTRAGARYGFALIGVVLLANVLKYPAFRFGPEYAAATGTSLLAGYRRQGKGALVIYGLATLATMFTVQAAVTVVTAGLAIHVLGLPFGALAVSAALTLLSVGLLAIGQYRWLERIGKVVVVALTLLTLIATALALGKCDWGAQRFWPSAAMFATPADLLFLAALAGWMPSAVDVSVWQSLWTLERADAAAAAGEARPGPRAALVDFHVGYVGTASLALCFLALGAIVLGGREVSPSAAGFAAQLVDLYGELLGAWSEPLIGGSALLVMFSTTLTVVDGFPRALTALLARWQAEAPPRDEAAARQDERERGRRVYWVALALLAGGALTILAFFLSAMRALVDIATTASFVTAPILSALNHRAMHGADIPTDLRPPRWLTLFSLFAIVAQAAFALAYLSL